MILRKYGNNDYGTILNPSRIKPDVDVKITHSDELLADAMHQLFIRDIITINEYHKRLKKIHDSYPLLKDITLIKHTLEDCLTF